MWQNVHFKPTWWVVGIHNKNSGKTFVCLLALSTNKPVGSAPHWNHQPLWVSLAVSLFLNLLQPGPEARAALT